jgi:hypothetical protein
MCKGHQFMCEFITRCYGMGVEGRGVTMMAPQHKAEKGPNVNGWDLTLVIDCTKEQHERLQELIGHQLAEDRLVNRPDLGKGVESGACWDLGAYMSELGKMDAKPETKQRNKYALNPKNKDGLDSKWQHSGKIAANTQVGDGTGTGKGNTVHGEVVRGSCQHATQGTTAPCCAGKLHHLQHGAAKTRE